MARMSRWRWRCWSSGRAACSLLLLGRAGAGRESLQVACGTRRRSACARRRRRPGGRRALCDLLLAPLGPASHGRCRRPRMREPSAFHCVGELLADAPRRRARGRGASRARSSSVLDLVLGHVLARDPDAGEEDLLVQAQAAPPDEYQPGDRRHARLGEAVDDHRGHPVDRESEPNRRCAACGRTSAAARGRGGRARGRSRSAAARSSKVIGRSTPGLQAGVETLAARAATRAERRDLEDLARRCRSSPTSIRVGWAVRASAVSTTRRALAGGEVHGLLAVGVGARQLGQLRVELVRRRPGPVDDGVAAVGRGLRARGARAAAPKCSWISASMTGLTEPRSLRDRADLLRDPAHEVHVRGVGRRGVDRARSGRSPARASGRSGRSGRCAAPAGTG